MYCCSISLVVSGPKFRLLTGRRRFPTNLVIHEHILMAFRSANFSRMWSKQSELSWVTLIIVLMTLVSASLSFVDWVTISSGQLQLSLSQSGPFNHSSFPFTSPPRLATSAGLQSVGTYRHYMLSLDWIFFTRFATNCLCCPPPLIQWSATVLSSQPYVC